MESYWTHNVAYHSWILRQVGNCAHVLDVGCGDGFLLQKLSGICGEVIGLEPDLPTAEKAKARVAEVKNASVVLDTFEDFKTEPSSFDCVIFVASLHHINQADGIKKAKSLLAPCGKLIVVGLAKPKTFFDFVFEAFRVIPAKIGPLVHGETNNGDIGVPVSEPDLSLKEIKEIARKELPGAVIRRALYYRYLLLWEKIK